MAQRPTKPERAETKATRVDPDDMSISETREKVCDSTSETLGPGSMVDHYEILERIGDGGMGAVFLAVDVRLKRKVALKVVRPEMLGSPKAVESFLYEARTTARFNHPNIVTVYGVGEHEGKPYLALEYVPGKTLRDHLRKARLPRERALKIAIAVAEALHEANEHGVQHRDLKPTNILLAKKGGTPKVLDFGLAKRTDEDAPPSSRGLFPGRRDYTWAGAGTPAYMAPEQWRMSPSTSATDVWALGAIMYEMFTGHRPFVADDVKEQEKLVCSAEPVPSASNKDNLPEALAEIIDRCLEKSPSDRPAAIEVAETLEEILEDISSKHVSLEMADTEPAVEGRSADRSLPSETPTTERRPLITSSAVAVVGGLIAAGLAGYSLSRPASAPATVTPTASPSPPVVTSTSAQPPTNTAPTGTTPKDTAPTDTAPTNSAPAVPPDGERSAAPPNHRTAPRPKAASKPLSGAEWKAAAQARASGLAAQCQQSCPWVNHFPRHAYTVVIDASGAVIDLTKLGPQNDTSVCCAQLLGAAKFPPHDAAGPLKLPVTVTRPK